ncbi:hypothetical protein CCH79_00011809, partial [Gambusia affinis]
MRICRGEGCRDPPDVSVAAGRLSSWTSSSSNTDVTFRESSSSLRTPARLLTFKSPQKVFLLVVRSLFCSVRIRFSFWAVLTAALGTVPTRAWFLRIPSWTFFSGRIPSTSWPSCITLVISDSCCSRLSSWSAVTPVTLQTQWKFLKSHLSGLWWAPETMFSITSSVSLSFSCSWASSKSAEGPKRREVQTSKIPKPYTGIICPARLDLPPVPVPDPAPLPLDMESELWVLENPDPAALWPRPSGAVCRCIMGGKCPEPAGNGPS